ncbi:MAG: peroxiredoxin family protein [Desulfonatronovibrio sp.]
MNKKIFICFSLFFFMSIPIPSVSGGNPVETGEILEEFVFQAPDIQKDKDYLGLAEEDSFLLKDLDADFFLIEVVGAYCPVCHAQSAEVNHLFNRISKDEVLKERMIMFSIVPGSTTMEIEHLRNSWKAPYPMLEDYKYDFHGHIGNPDTPYTIIVSKDGRVLYAHLGRILELNEFMEKINKIIE